jgi:beta-carotene hydroxylase
MAALTSLPNRKISNYVPDQHDLSVSPAEEKAIARELTPSVAWPTLILAMALPSTFVALVFLGFSRLMPLWLFTPILALVSYTHYTLVHESIHGNLAPGYPRWRWLNEIVGWAGSLGMGLACPSSNERT